MLNILIPAILAIGGGLFWLAFNHPDGYKKLYTESVVYLFLIYGFLLGNSISKLNTLSFLTDENVELTDNIRNYFSQIETNIFVIILCVLTTHTFLFLLTYLHELRDNK